MENEDKKELRSSDWIGRTVKDGFVYRAWMKNQGILQLEFNNKPVIGIFNTWSKLMSCNGRFRELAASAKRGFGSGYGFSTGKIGERGC